jgi:predicted nucleic acid-binding protein
MYLTDTNIVLEYLLKRDDAEECRNFLEKVESGDTTGIFTVFNLPSIAVISEDLGGIKQYREFLETINGFEGPYWRNRPSASGLDLEAVHRRTSLLAARQQLVALDRVPSRPLTDICSLKFAAANERLNRFSDTIVV